MGLTLSFAFSFSTLAGVGQPIIHELNIQGIRLCQSAMPFDCVSTSTEAVAPTCVVLLPEQITTDCYCYRDIQQYRW